MEKNNFKKENGITLIALIITIIIMLILVAVSINIIIKSDLFGAAQNAADKTKTAYEEEGKLGEIEIGGKKYNSIEDYIAKKEATEDVHNWFYVDETTRGQIRCECAECKAYDDGDSTGRTLSVGQQIYYTKTGTGSTTISAEKSGIAAAKEDGKNWAESYGDYQTVTLTGETIWVVFGYEDRDNNGTNETLLLTTKEPTTDEVTLYGAAAYNACGEGENNEIDRMCKELYGEDARGMKMEDINRAFGYTAPEAKKLKDTDNWSSIVGYNTNNKDGVFYDPAHPEGIKDGGAALGEYLVNYYYIVGNNDQITEIADSSKAIVYGPSTNYATWLASRGVYAATICAGFGPGSVYYGDADSGLFCFYSDGDSSFNSLALRAVVSLTSEIPSAGNDMFDSGFIYIEGENQIASLPLARLTYCPEQASGLLGA